MENLPQEVVDLITSFVKRNDRLRCANVFKRGCSEPPLYDTISKSWQYAVERFTFRSIKFNSEQLEELAAICTDQRKAYVARITYEAVLPEYEEQECKEFEDDDDQERNNQALTEAVDKLFETLKSWETISSISIDLHHVYSPMDASEGRRYVSLYNSSDLQGLRYLPSFLRLFNASDLPVLSRIKDFRAGVYRYRQMEPAHIVSMAAHMPNLEHINWVVPDSDKRDLQLAQDIRQDFAKALISLSLPSLRKAELALFRSGPGDHKSTPMNLLAGSSDRTDCLCDALRTFSFSQNLMTLVLQGPIVISPSLYWPKDDSMTPHWPHLRVFHVLFNMLTPGGGWYFTHDPDEPEEEDPGEESDPDGGWDEEEQIYYHAIGDYPFRRFRNTPDGGKLMPLLTAMARAAAQMPSLERMSFRADINSIYTSGRRAKYASDFGVEYVAPGVRSRLDELPWDEENARLYWLVEKWRPDEEVLELWKKGKGVDGELVVYHPFLKWDVEAKKEWVEFFPEYDGTCAARYWSE